MLNQRIVFYLALVVMLLACFMGGGQGFFGDVLAQLAAIGLIASCMLNGQSELAKADSTTRTLSLLFIAIVMMVPLLQLYPWPNTNEFVLSMQQDMQRAGLSQGSLSLNKSYGAERALFSLLPAIAVFMAALQLPSHYRYRLVATLAFIVVLNILMGFAQLAQGKTSSLRLYELTNSTEAVGFFANRNHFASLLMMCLPLSIVTTAWWIHQRASRVEATSMLFIGGGLLCILIVLAIAVARSRAVVLLAVPGVLLSLIAVFALPRRQGMKRVLGVVVLLGALAAIQFGLLGVLQRFDHGVADDTRMQMTKISIEAGKAYAPMGSGLGTFRQAYTPFEAKHEESVDGTLTNHAHNDYAEIWLEAGYPGLLAMSAFGFLFAVLGFRVWLQRKQTDSFEVLLSRAAWIGVLLALLHSYADYPLRTTADSTVFAFLLALAIAPSQKRKT